MNCRRSPSLQEHCLPFGRSALRTSERNRYRFIGVERDVDTGLCMTGPRTYDPLLGRFLQPDPLVQPGEGPFVYASGNPVGRLDPGGYADEPAQEVPGLVEIAAAATGLIDEELARKADSSTMVAGLPVGGAQLNALAKTFFDLSQLKSHEDPNHDSVVANAGFSVAVGAAGAAGALLRGKAAAKGVVAGAEKLRPPPAAPSPGVTVKRVGNYWIKEVNPEAPRLAQWFGKRSLANQNAALDRLGDMAPPHLLRNGKMITRDAGAYEPGRFWNTWWEGSKRLGTPMNDIRRRNIGANGVIFDPAWDPIAQGLGWTAVGLSAATAGATAYYLGRPK